MTGGAPQILARFGRRYGEDLLLVQAAGGNMSVKTSPKQFSIKASGVRLCEMTPAFGWAAADHRFIRSRLEKIGKRPSYRERELSYAQLLHAAGRTSGRRVSMEAGFHAIFPETFVLHLHSVAGILLGMMPEAQALSLIEKACEGGAKATFIPATLPGFDLTRRMNEHLRGTKAGRPQLWVLRNHGIVWASQKESALKTLIDRFERAARTYFQLSRYPAPHIAGTKECRASSPTRVLKASKFPVLKALCFCHWPDCFFALHPLFPDFVIYFNLWSGAQPDVVKKGPRQVVIGAASEAQWRDKMEVFYVHALVSTIARRRGWYAALPKPMIRRLKTMETERARKKQILKS